MKKLSAFEYVINRLAAREYSEKQLRDRMARKEYDEEDIEEAISVAIERKYLDDERFAASFVRQKAEVQHWGRQRIVQGLRQAGVSSAIIDETLEMVNWDAAWIEAYAKKYGDTLPKDPKDKQRRLGFMARRGFPPRLPTQEDLDGFVGRC